MNDEKIRQRLQALRQEFEAGQKMLVDIETQKADLQQTLLRISGAIQILEEILAEQTTAEKVLAGENGVGIAAED